MAVLADSNIGAFKGSINSGQLARLLAQSARFAVIGGGSLAVTAGGTGDRAVTVAAGEAVGDGVLSRWDTSTILNGAAVGSGSRWDTLVIRRTWEPANPDPGPYGKAELILLTGSASKALSTNRVDDPGVTASDQPIALLRFAAGSTVVQEVVDLRVWAGQGGGLVADNTDALLYLTEVGTVVTVGADRWVRTIDGGGNAVWQADHSQPRVDMDGVPIWGSIPSGTPQVRIVTGNRPLNVRGDGTVLVNHNKGLQAVLSIVAMSGDDDTPMTYAAVDQKLINGDGFDLRPGGTASGQTVRVFYTVIGY